MLWMLILVPVGSAISGLARGDDCIAPPGYNKLDTPWKCCKMDIDNLRLPPELRKHFEMCTKKNAPPDKSSDDAKAWACAVQCMYDEAKLLTKDGNVDRLKVTKLYDEYIIEGEKRSYVDPKVLEFCLATYTSEIGKDQKCNSGALELKHCIVRESFLNCPKKLWTDNKECSELRNKITNCSQFPIWVPLRRS